MSKTYTFGAKGGIIGATFDKLESPREERVRVHATNGLGYAPDGGTRTTELLAMLRTMRPAGSVAEREFVEQWVAPLGTDPDDYGNHWLTIGDSPIMWSCHTDTVHKMGGTQYVGFHDGCAYVTRSNCLGADDTAGVWIMRNMILAGVPGTYVFHRAEEVGGKGSSWIATNTPERLAGIDFAIAFDRMGYRDIITDQMGNTASDDFANSLAAALLPLRYTPSSRGVFTDTQNYCGLIAECSNISVGYFNQHNSDEWLDVDYCTALLDRILSASFARLVCKRDPTEDFDNWRDWDNWRDDRRSNRSESDYQRDMDKLWGSDSATLAPSLEKICRDYPAMVADFLESCGYTAADLEDYLGW